MDVNEQGGAKDVVAEAIAYAKKADELRKLAVAQLLEQLEQIQKDLKTLGHTSLTNGTGAQHPAGRESIPSTTKHDLAPSKRFREMTLADATKELLADGTTLHGKEIERLVKAGGFKGGTDNFQNYLPVALKRAGGFENVGGNRWRINAEAEAQR